MSEFVIKYFENGLTSIPVNTKTDETKPKVKWSQYKDTPPERTEIDEWIKQGLYNDGVAQITGLCHRGKFRGLYLNCADFDSPEALNKLLEMYSLEDLANAGMFVEQHCDNKGKAHVWIFSTKPFPKLASGYGIEVKSDGMLCNMFPSIHKSGNRYFPVGNSLKIFNDDVQPQTNDGFVKVVDKILDGNYLNGKASKAKGVSIEDDDSIKWHQGERFLKLRSWACSKCLSLGSKIELEDIRAIVYNKDKRKCEPSLTTDEPRGQIENICQGVKKLVDEKRVNDKSETNTNNQEPISVLEAKRLHNGYITVIGTVVSVSQMYVLEIKNNDKVVIEYKNAKSIQLEDTETLDDNDRLDVVLYDDMVNKIIAGETVKITGNMRVEDKKPNSKSKKKFNILHASSIEYLNKKEIIVTEEDIQSFEKFVTYPNLTGRLTVMFAPNIIGHNKIKRGLLRSAVGGVDRGKNGGGRIDTLEVGDPGTAKSKLGTELTEIKPNSRHVSAPHGTSKTITAVPEKINEVVTVMLGAIPLSKYGICAIDEINSWSMDEQGLLLDIMEEGFFDFNKMGVRRRIPAPTTIVATLNPVGGKWSDPNVATTEEFNLKRSLMDRFSQIYTTRDNMNEEQIDDFISDMDKINKRKPFNYNFLRKYLIYASSIKDVIFTNDARGLLNKYWKQGKLKNSLTIRMYKSLYKIAEAQAKLQLKDTVDEIIAQQTIDDFDDMMAQYDKTIGKILGPQEVAYKLCLDILQESDVGMTIEEMCRIATHRDNQVLNYLGYIWQTRHNKRLRDLVDSLLNHPNIKKIQNHPIVLQWLSDLRDLRDPKTENKSTENGENITSDIPETKNNYSENRSPRSPGSLRNEVKINVSEFIKLKGSFQGDKISYDIQPTVGDLSIQNNFMGGHLRMRGEGSGRYPTNYLEFIDKVFGPKRTIEVCSNKIEGYNKSGHCFTVDINPEHEPDLVADGQDLKAVVEDEFFERWRCDPPYNGSTAKEMYNTELPNVAKLLKEGCRIVKPNSLLFLLHSNHGPSSIEGLRRIGYLTISAIPNNETRILNIYVKLPEELK